MLGLIGTLGSAVISGISRYFKTKQEIKKVKVKAEKEVIIAESKAKIARLQRESEQDFTLDQIAMKNMQNSWKDEAVLIIWLIPLVLCFIPEYAIHIENGFKVLKGSTPEWYQYILIGMVVVIYGLRGLLRAFLQIIMKRL